MAFGRTAIRALGGIFALFFACAAPLGAAPAVTARLDRQAVPVGETVTLTLTFEGGQINGSPNLPALPNLLLRGTSQSQEFTIVNGQSSAKISINYALQATQQGDVVIPAMNFQVGGVITKTQPLALKILPANANPAMDTNQAFLRLILPKQELYVGEPLPIEIHLYYQNVRDVEMPELSAEGFSLTQPGKPGQTSTTVGDKAYNVGVFRLVATPAKSGQLTLGPVRCSLKVAVPVNRARRDPFDMFFGGNFQLQPMTLTSEAHVLRVLPLPGTNVPASFNGAIGFYTMNVSAGPTNVAVGDPITVKVQVSGRGAIESLKLPAQPQWRDFKPYPPEGQFASTDPLNLAGTKTFEQVLVPQNHEITVLPPLQFSYFDPTRGEYKTLSGPPIPLMVRPSATASLPPPSITNGAQVARGPVPQEDIIHIQPTLMLGSAAAAPLISQPWFVAVQFVPPLAWLSLFLLRKREDLFERNPKLRRRKEVAGRVRQGLKEMRELAAAQRTEDFFAVMFRVLQEQIGERLDLPASAITEAVIDERLHATNIPDETVRTLRDLFHACNMARYAPQKSSQELSAFIPRVESVLAELQKMQPA